MHDLRYPIGKLEPQPRTPEAVQTLVGEIKQLPFSLEQAIENLDEPQLQTPYRPEGWTMHQLVHHIADSHINAFIRFKLCKLENHPAIKPYEENDWVTTGDVKNVPINVSTTLLHSLHRRWVAFLKDVREEDWDRQVYHPESKREMSLWFLLQLYAWHGKHHVAHITALRARNNW